MPPPRRRRYTPAYSLGISEGDRAVNKLLSRITVNPLQCGGRPCIRGMRIRVVDILELLAAGLTGDQILEELPDLEAADIRAALAYAARRFDHPIVAA